MSAPSRNEDAALVELFESFRGEIYTLCIVRSLISITADVNDPADTCGINGIIKYLEKLSVNPENASALVALEIIQAPGMEEMTKSGFVSGWKANGYDF